MYKWVSHAYTTKIFCSFFYLAFDNIKIVMNQQLVMCLEQGVLGWLLLGSGNVLLLCLHFSALLSL